MAACVEIHSRGIIIPIRSLLFLSLSLSLAYISRLFHAPRSHALLGKRERGRRREKDIGKYRPRICTCFCLFLPLFPARDKRGDRWIGRVVRLIFDQRSERRSRHDRSWMEIDHRRRVKGWGASLYRLLFWFSSVFC